MAYNFSRKQMEVVFAGCLLPELKDKFTDWLYNVAKQKLFDLLLF